MKFRDIISEALDAIFPSSCVGCGIHLSRGALLCEACEAGVPIDRTFFCSVCLSRRPDPRTPCHPRGYSFGAATDYRNDAVRELILALKFRSARAAAKPLARMLSRYLRELRIASPDAVIVPVPLSRDRERNRGFNQAEAIAQLVAAEFGIAVAPRVLRRIRDTQPQSDIHERRIRSENVRGAFAVAEAAMVRQRTVILIDDVRTSGATLAEAVLTLRTVMPKRIYGIVVARA